MTATRKSAPAKKSAGKRHAGKRTVGAAETPAYDAVLEESGCDPEVIGERPGWDYDRAYRELFNESPEQYRDRTYGAPKRRRNVGD